MSQRERKNPLLFTYSVHDFEQAQKWTRFPGGFAANVHLSHHIEANVICFKELKREK